MRTIFCKKVIKTEDIGKDLLIKKVPYVKTKFSKTPPIENREFQSIFNIEYIEYSEDTKFASIYDKLMSKEVFAVNYKDLDHKAIFEKYESFNKGIAEKINSICEEDDLVVVNDSSLLLLAENIKCRIAFRNLKFDHCFIERVPYYLRILKSLFKGQKFFNTFQDYESFNHYCECTYELAGYELGGCWFLKPYVDKFLIIDILEHFNYHFDNLNGIDNLNPDRFDQNIMRKLKEFEIPKKYKFVLSTAYPSHLETFLKQNDSIKVRYLENFNTLSEVDHKTLLFLKTMYGDRFEIVEIKKYAEVIVEMIHCDVYVGDHYCELGKCLGKEVVEDDFDDLKLSKNILDKINTNVHRIVESFMGEEEYVKEFMRVNGYDIQVTLDMREDEIIEKYLKEIYKKIGFDDDFLFKNTILESPTQAIENNMTPLNSPVYRKINENSSEDAFYYKKSDLVEQFDLNINPKKKEVLKNLTGFNTFDECLKKRKKNDLEIVDVEKFKKFWNESKKIILADYDGTLAEIKADPSMAFPTPEIKELFKKYANSSNANLIICTGRSKKTSDEWFSKEIEVYAEHGALHRKNGVWTENDKITCLDQAQELIQYYIDRVPDTIMELKETGIAFHYRKNPTFDPSILYGQLRRIAGKNVTRGKDVIEIKSSSKDKVCEIVKPDLVLGDDVTDEDMFKVNSGVGIRVGKGISFADAYIENVTELRKLLLQLLE